MTPLDAQARRQFWSRPGTFAIVGGFEAPGKLSWTLLQQCQKDDISAVPVNPDVTEALGVRSVGDPAEIPSLAGIVCVRLDPHATAAIEKAAELGVPVWLSLGTASAAARAAAERTGADLIADACPMMYLNSRSYHTIHRVIAKLFGQY
jgi:predicted CoA-binding protein